MQLYLLINTIFLIINIFLCLAIIFADQRNVASTWSWVFLLMVFPVVGFLLYFVFGNNFGKEKWFQTKQEADPALHQLVQKQIRLIKQNQIGKQHQIGYQDPSISKYQDIIYMNLNSDAPLTQDNRVEIFTHGEDKFDELLRCIEKAKDHIHVLYYKVRKDELGGKVMRALTKKAQEGVEVRFLYDKIGSPGLSRRFFAELRKAGGEARPYGATKVPYVHPAINNRNHRKIVVIDGETGFIGGFNIGNEYVGRGRKCGHWRDTHLKLTGTAVHSLQANFFRDWSLSANKCIAFAPKYYPMPNQPGNAAIQIVSSGPDAKWHHIQNAFIRMIHAARESVYIQTPYFIPDESTLNALKTAALSGIDVKLMVPADSMQKMVQWAAQSYLSELMAAGVRCYFYQRGCLHAKTIVVDRKIASVGTSNFDIRSFQLNFEVNAFIYDPPTAGRLHQLFLHDLIHCYEQTAADHVRRSPFSKSMAAVMRLLSPIM
ncbi:cardiolipin synthase [Paenibacillus xerothermodurans]|uniref:Cardiolipin synthase n=1 Tax=Paenibacillus xerothermodurans TaxID=1977292 RepID=A0A2W1NA09_PAEXE|nr:cardiolipin synthase [Paenibacillus xerothermodurans]PZE21267.1 cardiolipin synthase [Paenibacillus xerothermodurans]